MNQSYIELPDAAEPNILDLPNTKYNETVELTDEDNSKRVKIICKEPYAQELYDLYSDSGITKEIGTKDFSEGQLCTVIAKTIDFDDKIIVAEEKFSKSSVIVPFRDYSNEPATLVDDDDAREFKVIITKSNSGDYYGSEKHTAAMTHREDLVNFMKTNKWFTVKIVSLVKGGYLALYKGTVKCFLPGSHAAANVIKDFNAYLNTELSVMIENYDSANDLFIVSYKKYVKHTLPQRVHELEFCKKYTGLMTNSPYAFGIFVELDKYFTGLLHQTEFENYAEFCDGLSGSEIDVYIKDIVMKKGEPRIILTDSPDKVDQTKLEWQDFKFIVEGKTLKYVLDKEDFHIVVDMPDGESTFDTDVSHLKGKIRIPNDGNVTIQRVDIIRKSLKLDFIDI